jgi:hypothetical protein
MYLYRMPLPAGDDSKDTTNELGWPGSEEHLQGQECEQIMFFFMFTSALKTRYYLQNFVEMKW